MALKTNATKIANLIDPEVLADYVESKLIDAIKFSPLARVYTDLQGRAGSTLTVPSYKYIGDASIVAEGDDIPIGKLEAATKEVTVKKAGKGVQLTDEAVLYSYGDPISEAGDQLLLSIASRVELDHLADLAAIGTEMTHTNATGKLTSTVINNALVKFGEDFDGAKVIFVSPQQHADLLNDENWVKVTDMGVDKLLRGVIGMISGCQVVVSNRITDDNYIVKEGALGLVLKRGTEVEVDRDIINKSTVMTGDKHYATWLADESKAIKIANVKAS
jgi:N4-gp56 family major capsid protein